ncbi:MAG: dual specificity protein phosphatase family protein [Theionarchaea archaeon]|nr:dual specificity protein phosphatase family protein [Theionarchaea archaeon]MBU7038598.1 dual specificity protein phosphatase family protein [Theionarchaea archaeon]
MNHIYWITPSLGGRCGPVRRPWNLPELYTAGIRTIISLDEQVNSREITASSIEHIPLYLPDIALTTPESKRQFVDAVPRFLEAATLLTAPAFVHCYAGNDRTGAMLSCYLIHQGIPPARAIAQVRTVNPPAMTTPGYTEAVYLYASKQPPP